MTPLWMWPGWAPLLAVIIVAGVIGIRMWWRSNRCYVHGCRVWTGAAPMCDLHTAAALRHQDDRTEDEVRIDRAETVDAVRRAITATYDTADAHALSVADQHGLPRRDALRILADTHNHRAVTIWSHHD